MTTQTEALKRYLDDCDKHAIVPDIAGAFHFAWQEALAQPEQAPVAFDVQKALRRAYHLGQNYWADADSESYAANKRSDKHRQNFDELCEEAFAYTTPPQRKPLTDEQREEIAKGWRGRNWTVGDIIDATEAAHNIKE